MMKNGTDLHLIVITILSQSETKRNLSPWQMAINETTEKATLRYPAFSEAKQISIPSSIYFGGKTYPVTEIASCSFENAFLCLMMPQSKRYL